MIESLRRQPEGDKDGFPRALPKNFRYYVTPESHSIRQLAQATGIPKSSVDRHCKALHRRAQEPEAVLWEQAVGYQWLQRLVFAVVFVFGIKTGVN